MPFSHDFSPFLFFFFYLLPPPLLLPLLLLTVHARQMQVVCLFFQNRQTIRTVTLKRFQSRKYETFTSHAFFTVYIYSSAHFKYTIVTKLRVYNKIDRISQECQYFGKLMTYSNMSLLKLLKMYFIENMLQINNVTLLTFVIKLTIYYQVFGVN